MKKIIMFSINAVWQLLKLVKPLYELVREIVDIIRGKRDGKEDADHGTGE